MVETTAEQKAAEMAGYLAERSVDQWADLLVDPSAERKVERTAAQSVVCLAVEMVGYWAVHLVELTADCWAVRWAER